MFNNLDWDAKPKPHTFGGAKIGKVEITPGVIFSIERHLKEHWEEGKYFLEGHYFSVGLEAYGCITAIRFDTQNATIAYLKAQMDKAPQYEAIKAKRDAIAKRIKPLQDKSFRLGEQIFSLLKG